MTVKSGSVKSGLHDDVPMEKTIQLSAFVLAITPHHSVHVIQSRRFK